MSNSDEPPHRYEVAIVGGGVAGMTLALMCEQHGIDYIALEGREPIDSERGAGVVLQPNSLRILDQLGLLDALYAQGQPLNHTETIDVDRNVLIKNDYMTKVHSRVGYDLLFLYRRTVRRVAYDAIVDKSRVKIPCMVTSMEEHDDHVVLHTREQGTIAADIVVGADGIRSIVRSHIDSMQPKKQTSDDYMTAPFVLCWGLSPPMDGIKPGLQFSVYHEHAGILIFTDQDGGIGWAVYKPQDGSPPLSQAPRYTDADADALCRSLADMPALPHGITFGQVYAAHKVKAMMVIEEGVAPSWHTHRAVLVGDSSTKVSPAYGMGANQAIGADAVLVNELMRVRKGSKPSRGDLAAAWARYTSQRQPVSRALCRLSRVFTQSYLNVEGPPARWTAALARMSADQFLYSMLTAWAAAPVLENLPLTRRGEKCTAVFEAVSKAEREKARRKRDQAKTSSRI